MKTIYKTLFPLGYEKHEVPDNFPVLIPFTDVKPLEGLEDPQSQYFNFNTGKWVEATTPNVSEQLERLQDIYAGVEAANTTLLQTNARLETKTASLDSQLTETQMAVAEVFEMVVSGGDVQ